MPEDIIKAYNKTKINGIYLYNCYLEPSIKSDLALSDYFSRLEVNKPIKDNDSIFFSLLKFTGNAFYSFPLLRKIQSSKKNTKSKFNLLQRRKSKLQRSDPEAKASIK